MMIPLVPLAAPRVAEVVVPVVMALPLVTSNDIMQPVPLGQLIGLAVSLWASTLRKIQSVE
jgi:hypothetical protein